MQAGALHSLRFDHFSIDQGLPSTGVLTVAQTRNGLIWMGTSNGLVRYDGRRVKLFPHVAGNVNSLSHSRVLSIFEYEKNQLWLGTRGGVDRLDMLTDQITQFPMPATLGSGRRAVFSIAPASRGRLWIASATGLLLFDPANGSYTRWSAAVVTATPQEAEVRAMLSDGKGGVWIGQQLQIFHIDQDGSVLQQFSTIPSSQKLALSEQATLSFDKNLPLPAQVRPLEYSVRSLGFDDAGNLWVGLSAGLQIWQVNTQPASAIALPPALALPKGSVTAILQDQDQAIWLAMGDDRGLFRWRSEPKHLEGFHHLPSVASSLSGDTLTSLMLDASGGLWIGTSDYGANLVDLSGRGFSTYLNVPGDERSLSHRLVTALAPEDNDHIWIGTGGGGVNRLQLSTGDTQRIDRKLIQIDNVRALLLDQQRQLWIGGETLQVYNVDTHRVRTIPLATGLPAGTRFTGLLQDAKGRVWGSTLFGLFRFDPDHTIVHFRADDTRPDALSDDAVDSILIDKEQRLWVGTKSALQLWDESSQGFYKIGKKSAGIPTPEKLGVTSLRQTPGGRIFAATLLGLLEVRPVLAGRANASATASPSTASDWELVSWSPLPGLPADVFEAMEVTENGDIWLSSERGLMQVQADLKQGRNYPAFGRFDGAFSFAAAARGSDGSLFFGGVGLVRFHPNSVWSNKTAPPVILSDVLLFNRSLLDLEAVENAPSGAGGMLNRNSPTGDKLEMTYDLPSIGVHGPLSAAHTIQLNHQQSMVSFELAALYFYNRTQIRYAWKLDGYDADWIFGQGDRATATYTNLDPGTYRLLAKAANPDGVWSASAEILVVQVAPPFWRTWWWYGLWLLVVALVLRFGVQWRLKAIRLNQLQLQEQVQIQTQEILEQKRLADAQKELAERARNDIGKLSEIGLKITASLDVQEVLTTVYLNVKALIHASTLGVGFVDWEKRQINFEYTMQDDKRLQPYLRSLDAIEQPSARCVLSGQELIVDEITHDTRKLDTIIARQTGLQEVVMEDGSPAQASCSGIYVPMILKGRVMGVIAVLSTRVGAYNQNDLNILATLATYAAVAYDNADAYRRLQLTQSKLVEQEKMAALGSLVAGVAHELNTPIGNTLLMASTLQEHSKEMLGKLESDQLKRSELTSYCEKSNVSAELMVRSLSNAAHLVSSFKQIAVDQTSDQRRVFDLGDFCEEVALTLSNRIKREHLSLQLEVQEGLELDSYPGSLGQVLNNLIMNAIMHGLHERQDGVIRIRGSAQGNGQIVLVVQDNGHGISAANIEHIFEPFFTTRLGKGGSGLGLHICYNIIHSILGGEISVQSTLGQGATFSLIIPRIAPIKLNANDVGPS